MQRPGLERGGGSSEGGQFADLIFDAGQPTREVLERGDDGFGGAQVVLLHNSVTNRALSADPDGRVCIAIGALDFGYGHWLDTGGRRRGFVVLR